MSRIDGRMANQLRPVRITPNFIIYPEGSALIEMGNTRVLCTVSVENTVPGFLKGSGQGWLTAEYGMLPRATNTRNAREAKTGKQTGRTVEIQRLIGRSLRAAVDLSLLGERTITVDCDVLQADGGTRTAAITGSMVAVQLAAERLIEAGELSSAFLKHLVGAVSVGVIEEELMLDLCYAEDSTAIVDFNVVMLANGQFVEVQGTGEGGTFSRQTMNHLMDMAVKGIESLFLEQRVAIESVHIQQAEGKA